MKKNEKVFLELIKQGVYKIYKNGNIYKCKRKVRGKNKYKECDSVLQKLKVGKGYIRLQINYQGRRIRIFASRLIWLYFNGEILENLEINHKNGIKTDNRLINLEIVTHKKNLIHAFKIGLRYNDFGENSFHHKLKNKDILKIRKLLEKDILQYKIAKMFNVTNACISVIKHKKNWSQLAEVNN